MDTMYVRLPGEMPASRRGPKGLTVVCICEKARGLSSVYPALLHSPGCAGAPHLGGRAALPRPPAVLARGHLMGRLKATLVARRARTLRLRLT